MTDKTLGLYIHIPFCISKCPYCDFYSGTDDSLMGRYTDALVLHMEDYAGSASSYDVDTVYFGGGTPTSMPVACLLDVTDGIYDNFTLREDTEFTVEANPATVTYQEFRARTTASLRPSEGCIPSTASGRAMTLQERRASGT